MTDYKADLKKGLDIEKKIINELLYLGYNFSYKGTTYLLESIKFIALHPYQNTDKLEKNVYPIIANLYKDTVHNVKSNINRANNAMYYECKIEKMKEYFWLDRDIKPKVKFVINTILNKIQ